MPETKLGKLLKSNLQSISNTFTSMKRKIGSFHLFNASRFSKKIINKKRFALTVFTFITIIAISLYIYFSGIAYSVQVNGVEIGKIKNEKLLNSVKQKLEEQYMTDANSNIMLKSEITIIKTRARSKNILDEAELLEVLKANIGYKIETYSIYANGSIIAAFRTMEEAEEVLNEVKSHFAGASDTSKYKEIAFSESVEVKQEFNEFEKIMNKDEAAQFIIKGTNETKIHKIVSGESFWSISRKYDMSTDELIKANPGVNPEKIKIGQELNLIIPKPLISVKTVETITYNEKVQFDQKVEFSSTMYKDETRIRVAGVYGEKKIVADVTKINGIETERVLISETQIKAPKEQIIVKGTKELPPKKGTGTFSMPTRGRLTSAFGTRWGKQHTGIDLAASIGTTVNSSDGGVVTWVGTQGSYGKLIIIDHGAGYVTYYGHLSKYNVSVGDKVYKGQKIGEVGNTGKSTGPHLHFEVRKNGVPQNPLKYIK